MKALTHRFVPWLLDLTAVTRCFVIALLLHAALLVVIGSIKIVEKLPDIIRPPQPRGPIEPIRQTETETGPEGQIPLKSTSIANLLGPPVVGPARPSDGGAGTPHAGRSGPNQLFGRPDAPVGGRDFVPFGVNDPNQATWIHPGPGGGLQLTELVPRNGFGKVNGVLKGLGSDSGLTGRTDTNRTVLVEKYVGKDSARTERAVTAALRWLKTQQQPDGSWPGGSHTPALSGLALLCFFGRADDSDSVEFGSTIDRGLRYLVSTVKSDGLVTGNMYHQGIVAIALAEAYSLTGQPALRDPLQRSIRVILAAQQAPKLDPTDRGGWRYTPRAETADLSVSGWQIMALKSAKTAGIDIPDVAFSNAVDYVWNRYGGTGFAYTGGGAAYAMTGVGTLSQLFLGQGRDQRLEKACALLTATPPAWEQANLYAWYYAALALYQVQGRDWESWNKRYWQTLVDHQHQDDGYWELPVTATEATYGRVYATTLCTLMLEVYYRYLPMYRRGAAVRPSPHARAEPTRR